MVGSLLTGRTEAFLTVPFPKTPFLYVNTVLTELFIGGIIVAVYLCSQYLNTKGNTYGTDEKRLRHNYKKATRATALAIAVFSGLMFNFGGFTFNNVPYWAGLSAGIVGVPAAPANYRDINQMAYLTNVALYPGSVFIGASGYAWPLYLFMPWAAGVIGAVVFWLLFVIGGKNDGEPGKGMPEERFFKPVDARADETELRQLRSPLLTPQ
jgi:hypothetical protein